jgi:cytochrome c553
VEVFDKHGFLIKEIPDYALLEPIPLRAVKRPPAIPSKVDLARRDAQVYLADIYAGPGLAGIPRGTVKQLRLFTYHFAYHGMGGQNNRVGLDGPWDIKRVLGTVPVQADGSALFSVPANTPISIQPLDAEGKALQLMRSWLTAMPGETLSCVGCHERQNSGPPAKATLASQKAPDAIKPWYGPTRGFAFSREVQPVLDHYCVSCHDGGPNKTIPDFRALPPVHPPAPDRPSGMERSLRPLTWRCAVMSAPPQWRGTCTCSHRPTFMPTPPNLFRCSDRATTTSA